MVYILRQHNMLKLMSILMLSSPCNFLIGQEYYNKLEDLVEASGYQAEQRLDYILRKEFSQVINTNANGMIGNYVGLSTKDNTLSFAYSYLLKNGILDINFSGTSNDGISGLFAENKFQSNIQLGLDYNLMFGKKNMGIDMNKVRAIRKKIMDAQNEHNLFKSNFELQSSKLKSELDKKKAQGLEVDKKIAEHTLVSKEGKPLNQEKDKEYTRRKNLIQAKIDLFKSQIATVKSTKQGKLDKVNKEFIKIKKPNDFEKKKYKVEKLKIETRDLTLKDSLKIYEKHLADIENKTKQNTFQKSVLDELKLKQKKIIQEIKIAKDKHDYHVKMSRIVKNNEMEDKRKKALDEFQKIRAEDVKINWISIGGDLASASYDFFDTSLPMDSQIFKESDLIPSLKFSFSHFKSKQILNANNPRVRKISYYTIGGTMKFGNNIGSLTQDQLEIIDTVSIDHRVLNTQKVYSGTLESNIRTGRIFCDYYQLGYSRSNVGFHLRGTLDIGPSDPVFSVRVGALISAMKRDDAASIVNFEVFYGLNDVFREGGEGSILSRNIFGLQTTFPFNFN